MANKLWRLVFRHRRLVLFCAVGAVNTLADFLTYAVLHRLTDLTIGLCQAAGYAVGILCSFILNRSLTFRRGATTGLLRQVIRFIAVNGVSMGLSVVMAELLVGKLGLHPDVAKIPVTAATMLINYFGYKLLVFAVKEEEQ